MSKKNESLGNSDENALHAYDLIVACVRKQNAPQAFDITKDSEAGTATIRIDNVSLTIEPKNHDEGYRIIYKSPERPDGKRDNVSGMRFVERILNSFVHDFLPCRSEDALLQYRPEGP